MIATRLRAFYNPFIGFLPSVGLAVILLVGGRQVIDGTLSLGDFTAFYTYLLMLIAPMRQLGIALGLAQRATASGARLFEILDRAPGLVAPPGAPPLPGGTRPGRAARRHLPLRAAPRGRRCRDVDLVVEAGTTVALVGATGSGKTTLVQLLAAALRRQRGRGADRRRRRARRRPAVAARRRSASSTTTRSCSARPCTRTSPTGARTRRREEVERAAERAQAAGFIAELPDGYDTRIGERGLTLSGGQRQRIAIARALLSDPRILILDDATSSVDASTEQAIKDALREVMAGRTTFVIAHRLSTIALADEIVVLEDGRIAARGTHAELLERSPLYAEIAAKGLPDQVFLTRKPTEPRSRRCERRRPHPARRPRPALALDRRPRAQAARAARAAAALPRAHDR